MSFILMSSQLIMTKGGKSIYSQHVHIKKTGNKKLKSKNIIWVTWGHHKQLTIHRVTFHLESYLFPTGKM